MARIRNNAIPSDSTIEKRAAQAAKPIGEPIDHKRYRKLQDRLVIEITDQKWACVYLTATEIAETLVRAKLTIATLNELMRWAFTEAAGRNGIDRDQLEQRFAKYRAERPALWTGPQTVITPRSYEQH